MLFSFDRLTIESGDNGEVDTPVLIPNTEVKHFSGDNIQTCSSEDSTSPGKRNSHEFLFLLFIEHLECILDIELDLEVNKNELIFKCNEVL